ncbi:MAG: LL-diaminopimelate aminotransferase [Phycisphaerae bacterium]|nr:LL-diaminopimelate aminotransferase [Phycisphaerae bacterium]
MNWRHSKRLGALPSYLFAEIDRTKRRAIEAGKDVIDLGVGDPDRPTFGFIVDRMREEVGDPANHRYPFGAGIGAFRSAAANFMKARYGVDLDPTAELMGSIGSKDAIAHLPLAVVDPHQVVLIPRPGYPVYNAAAVFAGGEPVYLPLRRENGWVPDLDAIDADVARRARLIYVNYPNNPTAAVAPLAWYEKLIAWAGANEVIVASDAAYNEVYFDSPPPSILQVSGAKDLAVEFHSLSKTFNMTGWRIGFVAGNPQVVSALGSVKSNVDSGQFNAIQWAAVAAMENYTCDDVVAQRKVYAERRDVLCDALERIGFDLDRPSATFYVWGRCPDGVESISFAKRSLSEANVVFIPGVGFGEPGEGYFRAALTVEADRLSEAVDRLAKLSW